MKHVSARSPFPGLVYLGLMALGVLVAAAFVMTVIADEAAAAEPVPGSYEVVQGKVDRGTYAGWKVFHTNCYGCHGADALGTDVAPSLVERVKLLSPREFALKVLTRYRIVVRSSETGDDQTAAREAIIEEVLKQERGKKGEILMPPWEKKAAVKPHVLNLYAYLSARADGALGPGRPRLLKKK